MARIKHIALSTDDPVKTAEFYKKVFGLTELRREDRGVWLSDGYIYFAILRRGDADTPPLDGGPAATGVHHIGFYVESIDQTCAALEAAGCSEYPGTTKVNRKYTGPGAVGLDVRERGWDEQIKARMQLYQLTPAS